MGLSNTSKSRFDALRLSSTNQGQSKQLSQLSWLKLLPIAVYAVDAEGRIDFYNQAAADLWGRHPNVGEDTWCGSVRILRADGTPIALDASPLAIALRERRVVCGHQIVIERTDGSTRHVLAYARPIWTDHANGEQTLAGAVNVLVDVTERAPAREALHETQSPIAAALDSVSKASVMTICNGGIAADTSAQNASALLGAIVDSSDDAIISKDLNGIITSWNKSAERVFGYSAAEAIGQHIFLIIPTDRHDEEPKILARLKRGERVDHFETVRRHKDGSRIDISLTISPIRDMRGRVIGASKTARDISERKRLENELRDYREHLEQLVDQRTAELAETHSKLRSSERLSAIGTLSAGLGHDIGNVMMPLNAHIKFVESSLCEQSEPLREHFEAIHRSVEYLQSLANGLRLLAIDPHQRVDGAISTVDLHKWWPSIEPLLKTALTKRFQLRFETPPPTGDLPPVAIPQHALTQAVFNLVQNAGHAMATRLEIDPDFVGVVRVVAEHSGADESIRISVIDNGPGMTSDVKAHCLEPFFTTKTRTISTGLGLAVVHGIVRNAQGTLEIESAPGLGSKFTMVLPAVPERQDEPAGMRPVAIVSVSDARMRALVSHELAMLNFEVVGQENPTGSAQLLVVTSAASDRSQAADFLRRNPHGQALIIGGLPTNSVPRVVEIGPMVRLEAVRHALRDIALSACTMQK